MLPGSQTSACCDSVRSPLHDSLASRSLCPCQLDRVLQQRVSTMPVNLLPRPTFNETGFTIGAADLAAFYSPLVSSGIIEFQLAFVFARLSILLSLANSLVELFFSINFN